MEHYNTDTSYAKYLFHQGKNFFSYKLLGAHFTDSKKNRGAIFRVWAPRARAVSVVGTFNDWDENAHPMKRLSPEGIWECKVASAQEFSLYKFCIITNDGRRLIKADPYAFHSETKEKTASVLYDLNDKFTFADEKWMMCRGKGDIRRQPLNIYEAHLGSWRRYQDGNTFDYKKCAEELIPYVKEMGYTHVELLPVMEYPFDGSWGYQVSGYFAATSRYGPPEGLMYFIDFAHRHDIGVLLDWVPAHFPKDEHGLYEFDGYPLYEYEDPLMREHPQWDTRMFDYGREEVISFLISSAVFWIKEFHVDGLRVDAVAAMLYLDFQRKEHQWRPNEHGGKENAEAVRFLKLLNKEILTMFPDILMIAEESSPWPMVTYPPDAGGLGFHFKWNMGWMNDALSYITTDFSSRKYHHHKLTFPLMYMFSENYILPISHDEVVHGKRSLLDKMPGNYEEKFAGLRGFLLYMYTLPGKKLMFMGAELAQFKEWDFQTELDWCLLAFDSHRKAKEYFCALNAFYLQNTPLWELDTSWDGFEWTVADDGEQSVMVYVRKDKAQNELLIVINFQPRRHAHYRIGCSAKKYRKVFSSNSAYCTGEDKKQEDFFKSAKGDMHGYSQYITLDIMPLEAMVLKPIADEDKENFPKSEMRGGKHV